MPSIGGLSTRGGDTDHWEHPEFPDSYFVQLSATTGSDAVWNDTPVPLDLSEHEEVIEELLDEVSEVETNPNEIDLWMLVGVGTRVPTGAPQLMLFERKEK